MTRIAISLWQIIVVFTATVICIVVSAFIASGLLVATALVLLLLLAGMVWQQYITPVQSIRAWTQSIRAGDLGASINIKAAGDYQNIARELRFLGEMLQSQSQNNDAQLQRHTHYIAQKTKSLSLLYDVATNVNLSRDIDALLTQYLHTITEMINAGAAAIYRVQDVSDRVTLVSHIGLNEAVLESFPSRPNEITDQQLHNNIQISQAPCPELINSEYFNGLQVQVLVVPLQYRGQMLGMYNFYVSQTEPLDEDTLDVCLAIGRHLGSAIAKERLDLEATTVSVMQERTHIANELHDSLAQTLTSIRFQIRVLDATLQRGDDAQAWQELERIEASISEAHTEIRELIAYFRAPTGVSLADSVEQIIERFRHANDDIHVFFQNEWPDWSMPPEIEYQVARIIQESLTNIRKHSEAKTVRILMRETTPGQYRVLIEDDGVGFEAIERSEHRGEHIGLSIMQDRAHRIGGTVQFESEPGEGVQVILEFAYAAPKLMQK